MKLIHSKLQIESFVLSIQHVALPIGTKVVGVTYNNGIFLHIAAEPFKSQEIRKFVLYAEDYIIDNNETIKEYIQMICINGFFYHLYEVC